MKNIIIYIFFINFFITNVTALDFKVASYNVENLFDLVDNNTEYKEYKPNSKYWNEKAFNKKLKNIVKVINDLDAQIISFQEIENQNAFNILLNKLPRYKYHHFLKKKTSSIGVGIFSIYPIVKNESLVVNEYNPRSRPILKSTIKIYNNFLIIYSNYWKSKRSAENTRIPYARALLNDIKTIDNNIDYIILGDLNSNYNEYISFQNNKNLNNTQGITGINQVFNTSKNGNLIKKSTLIKNKIIHYNLWLELKNNKRFSSVYRSNKITPDNFILPYQLFDNKNINYINNSFNVFNKTYLSKYNKPKRWNMKKKTGFSDHYPIYASFSTKIQKYIKNTKIKENNIEYLYNIQKLNNSILLENVKVIFKYENITIINDNKRAILIYNKNSDLQLGYSYNIDVHTIKNYYGTKEITKYNVNKLISKIDYENFYLNFNSIDIFDEKYLNEIITNIKGIYIKNYLYFGTKKVKLYFKNNIIKPKNNTNIEINRAHLNKYNSKTQLTIYRQSDFKANYR